MTYAIQNYFDYKGMVVLDNIQARFFRLFGMFLNLASKLTLIDRQVDKFNEIHDAKWMNEQSSQIVYRDFYSYLRAAQRCMDTDFEQLHSEYRIVCNEISDGLVPLSDIVAAQALVLDDLDGIIPFKSKSKQATKDTLHTIGDLNLQANGLLSRLVNLKQEVVAKVESTIQKMRDNF